MRKPLPDTRRPAAVLPLVTICLVGLMAFLALAIDVGMMAVARTQAQSAADIAALGGARTLNGQTGNNVTAAVQAASDAATSNSILTSQITTSQVVTIQAGVYKYNATAQRFQADFIDPPSGLDSYGAMQVRISPSQSTFSGGARGVTPRRGAAEATAAPRPRDIAISLVFWGSMKFCSKFNSPPISGSVQVTGSLNPDPTFPRFGPWSLYPIAT